MESIQKWVLLLMTRMITNKDKLEMNKGEKVTITLAIDENTLNQIRKEVQEEGLSINSKANLIFKKYTLFYRYTEVDRPVIISSKSFSFMLAEIDEEKLIEEYVKVFWLISFRKY